MAYRAQFRSTSVLLLLTFWGIGGCKPNAPDVLQEFPPPRLAKLAPNIARRAREMTARCTTELALRTRSESTTLTLGEAHGTFELPASGSRDMNATLSVALPADVAVGSMGSPGPLVWRVIEVRRRGELDGLTNTSTGSGGANSMQVVAEFEYNRVRTQNVHLLEFENSDDPGAGPVKVHLSRLSLDPGAHRLQFPTGNHPPGERPNSPGNSLKRAELTFNCGLLESDRSQP